MGNRYLVLDSRIIESTDNAKITITAAEKDKNNPLFVEDKPWEIRFDNLYPNVMYDQEDQLYKCWYSPFIVDNSSKGMILEERQKKIYNCGPGREMGVCYATSKDGIVWDKPELNLVEFKGNNKNNLVYRGPHGAGILKDLREKDSSKRYKMFTSSDELEMAVCFSSDGIQWGPLSLCPEINPYPIDGTHYNALWVEENDEYVGFTRLRDKREGGSDSQRNLLGAWPPRQIGRTTSKDFLNWTQATPVTEGLDFNLQIYSMPVFRHGNIFLGLPVIHNQESDRTWIELAWSADTIEWHRVCPGSSLIANSDPVGSYDWGCVYSSAYPIILAHEIRLYYGASNWLHTSWRDGFFCMARLRPDGFAGYQQLSAREPAHVVTMPLRCSGGELCLSADVTSIGSVQVRLLEKNKEQLLCESEPINQVVTDGVVKWRDGFSMDVLSGQDVRIAFTVNGAKLYSFGFDLASPPVH